jgi:hypothetical protein
VFSLSNFYVEIEAFVLNECIKIHSCDQPRRVDFKTNVFETNSISIMEG